MSVDVLSDQLASDWSNALAPLNIAWKLPTSPVFHVLNG